MSLDSDKLLFGFIQSVLTSGLLGIIIYFLQRKYKFLDSYKIEKHKAILAKTITAEDDIYKVISLIISQPLASSTDLVSSAQQLMQIRKDSFLYISDEVYKISQTFGDYLLEASIRPSRRSPGDEQNWTKQFKKAFRK